MGNCNFNGKPELEEASCIFLFVSLKLEINKTHFRFHSVLGKGGFGRVSKYSKYLTKYRFGR